MLSQTSRFRRTAAGLKMQSVPPRWRKTEIIFTNWSLLALAALLPVTSLLDGSFPLFTVLWVLVPLIAVARARDASRVGFRAILRERCAGACVSWRIR
jgi:hypothetical protein